MDIILWRHAEAEDGVPDDERRLTSAGRRQAERMGAWLDAHLPKNTRVLSSPAVRALQTAEAARRDVARDAALAPGATVSAVLEAVQWPQVEVPVLIVGHQPTLGALACYLMSGRERSWKVRKAAAWWFTRRERGSTEVALAAVLDPDWL